MPQDAAGLCFRLPGVNNNPVHRELLQRNPRVAKLLVSATLVMPMMMLGGDARDAGWRLFCWFRLPGKSCLETLRVALCLLACCCLLVLLALRPSPFCLAVLAHRRSQTKLADSWLLGRRFPFFQACCGTRQARPLLGLGFPLTLLAP